MFRIDKCDICLEITAQALTVFDALGLSVWQCIFCGWLHEVSAQDWIVIQEIETVCNTLEGINS